MELAAAAAAAAGCCCSRSRSPRAISRALFLLPCIVQSFQELQRRGISREEELPVVVGIREGIGESSLATRNNGVLPTYPRGFFVLGEGSKRIPKWGKTKTRWRFWFFERCCSCLKSTYPPLAHLFIRPSVPSLSRCLNTGLVQTLPVRSPRMILFIVL